jgi:hypothetical protein
MRRKIAYIPLMREGGFDFVFTKTWMLKMARGLLFLAVDNVVVL